MLRRAPDDAPSPVAVVSVDPQGSATWWAKIIGDDNLPFHLIQAHDDSLDMLRSLNNLTQSGISHVFVDTPGWHRWTRTATATASEMAIGRT